MAIRFGILGPGAIADQRLVPSLKRVAGAELWSVLSRDAARGKSFAERHGARAAQPVRTSLDELLADPKLDAVIVASPDKLHAPQAIAAARAKKHVFVEKPMATTPEEARAMVEACRDADVRLGVAYHLRWHAGHRLLVRAVHGGA